MKNKNLRFYLLILTLLMCLKTYAQDTLRVSQGWGKSPSRCSSKDGIINITIDGGEKPYHVYRNAYNGKSQDTVIFPIKNADYKTRDTFYITDSSFPPKKNKYGLIEYVELYPEVHLECVQEFNKPNKYFIVLDSVRKVTYPYKIYFGNQKTHFPSDSIEIKVKSNVSLNIKKEQRRNLNSFLETNYWYMLDSGGCRGGGSYEPSSPVADTKITLTPDTVKLNKNLIPKGVIEFSSNVKDYQMTYTWYRNGTQLMDKTKQILIDSFETAQYQIKVTDWSGCKFEAISYVVIVDSIKIDIPTSTAYLPTAFSPNDDGINDYFTAFSGGEVTKILLMQVYDRWGGLLFENQDFEPNVESYGWNGKQRGTDMPQGNYTYHLRLLLKDGSEKTAKGEVLLIR